MSKKVKVVQIRSANNRQAHTRGTLLALGLGRIGKVREHELTPSTAGMLKSVQHLVTVHPVEK
ncbi:MAG: 50S ribosomal protein L30 [Bdellovibrionota bacterium]